jgi:hypothetical protein
MDVCPYYARGRFGCECPIEKGIIHKCVWIQDYPRGVLPPSSVMQASYYPKASMLCVGGFLLSVRHVGWGKHFWQELIDIPEGILMQLWREKTQCYYNLTMIYATRGSRGETVACTWACLACPLRQRVLLLVYLRRIQRGVKKFLASRRSSRYLAFSMGLHDRLGRNSVVGWLHRDTLTTIILKSM